MTGASQDPSSRSPRVILDEMLESVALIKQYTQSMTYEAF